MSSPDTNTIAAVLYALDAARTQRQPAPLPTAPATDQSKWLAMIPLAVAAIGAMKMMGPGLAGDVADALSAVRFLVVMAIVVGLILLVGRSVYKSIAPARRQANHLEYGHPRHQVYIHPPRPTGEEEREERAGVLEGVVLQPAAQPAEPAPASEADAPDPEVR